MEKENIGNALLFGGTIVTFNPMDYDDRYFGGAMTLSGYSARKESDYIYDCDVGFLIPKTIWDFLVKKGVNVGSYIEVAGHFESWKKIKESLSDGEKIFKDKTKLKHVVDQVINL